MSTGMILSTPSSPSSFFASSSATVETGSGQKELVRQHFNAHALILGYFLLNQRKRAGTPCTPANTRQSFVRCDREVHTIVSYSPYMLFLWYSCVQKAVRAEKWIGPNDEPVDARSEDARGARRRHAGTVANTPTPIILCLTRDQPGVQLLEGTLLSFDP